MSPPCKLRPSRLIGLEAALAEDSSAIVMYLPVDYFGHKIELQRERVNAISTRLLSDTHRFIYPACMPDNSGVSRPRPDARGTAERARHRRSLPVNALHSKDKT